MLLLLKWIASRASAGIASNAPTMAACVATRRWVQAIFAFTSISFRDTGSNGAITGRQEPYPADPVHGMVRQVIEFANLLPFVIRRTTPSIQDSWAALPPSSPSLVFSSHIKIGSKQLRKVQRKLTSTLIKSQGIHLVLLTLAILDFQKRISLHLGFARYVLNLFPITGVVADESIVTVEHPGEISSSYM